MFGEAEIIYLKKHFFTRSIPMMEVLNGCVIFMTGVFVVEGLSELYWIRGSAVYDDKIRSDSSEFETRSLLECGKACTLLPHCSGFSYSNSLLICQHHSVDTMRDVVITLHTMKYYTLPSAPTTPTTSTTSTTTMTTTTTTTTQPSSRSYDDND